MQLAAAVEPHYGSLERYSDASLPNGRLAMEAQAMKECVGEGIPKVTESQVKRGLAVPGIWK